MIAVVLLMFYLWKKNVGIKLGLSNPLGGRGGPTGRWRLRGGGGESPGDTRVSGARPWDAATPRSLSETRQRRTAWADTPRTQTSGSPRAVGRTGPSCVETPGDTGRCGAGVTAVASPHARSRFQRSYARPRIPTSGRCWSAWSARCGWRRSRWRSRRGAAWRGRSWTAACR